MAEYLVLFVNVHHLPDHTQNMFWSKSRPMYKLLELKCYGDHKNKGKVPYRYLIYKSEMHPSVVTFGVSKHQTLIMCHDLILRIHQSHPNT